VVGVVSLGVALSARSMGVTGHDGRWYGVWVIGCEAVAGDDERGGEDGVWVVGFGWCG
jgi:hypothetical protein